MIKTGEIVAAYPTVEQRLSERLRGARSSAAVASSQNVRLLNAHPYFMLLFGRFEKHVVDKSAALVAKKAGSRGWKRLRLWKDLNPKRLGFMQRVALLTDPSQATYSRIHDIYRNIRCPIAHGDSATVGAIVRPALGNELRRLSSQLRG